MVSQNTYSLHLKTRISDRAGQKINKKYGSIFFGCLTSIPNFIKIADGHSDDCVDLAWNHSDVNKKDWQQ